MAHHDEWLHGQHWRMAHPAEWLRGQQWRMARLAVVLEHKQDSGSWCCIARGVWAISVKAVAASLLGGRKPHVASVRPAWQPPPKPSFFGVWVRRETYVTAEPGESPNDRNDRAIRVAAAWYAKRLPGQKVRPGRGLGGLRVTQAGCLLRPSPAMAWPQLPTAQPGGPCRLRLFAELPPAPPCCCRSSC
jgi:hypothetical protein